MGSSGPCSNDFRRFAQDNLVNLRERKASDLDGRVIQNELFKFDL